MDSGEQIQDILQLTAADVAAGIDKGEFSCEQLIVACLRRIEAREETVRAWVHLDPENVLEQARAADAARATGNGIGPLHGVPVAIKDIIDTKDMPTENGSPVFEGRQAAEDASLVAQLRDAGAIIMGKSVTTELAASYPGKTRNPHNPEHTPGGSSSGSAAAVADFMVPIAVGTQTGGSVIRPAAFCGVFGFKPTFGLISRSGVLTQSEALDTMGVYGRSIEDLAIGVQAMSASDARDPASWARSRPPLRRIAMSDPPMQPVLAFVRSPVWEQAEDVTRDAFAELVETLGPVCDEVELPPPFARGYDWQKVIQNADMARNYGAYLDKSPDKISARLAERIEEGRKVLAVDYMSAMAASDILYAGLEEVFERYDAIITPAAPGPAPKGLERTGNPIFNALWTYLGVPAVNLPLFDIDGLPLGVQLVGPRRDDGRLLRTARWLVEHLAAEDDA